MNEYDALIKRIENGKRFLVVSHYNPDGDGIGSMLALGILIKRMGREAMLYNRDGVPDNLKFLPQAGDITARLNMSSSFDLGIMVDCAQRKRISDDFAKFGGCREVACIDHHILEAPEADLSLIDSGASSTGEVVLRLIKKMGGNVCPDIAQCIYTTIVVDTGFFKYSNTNEGIFGVAGELVRLGASPWTVAKNIEESYPVSRMRLLALSLASLKMELGGKYATMDVTDDMLKKSGATMDLSDEFAVFPRSIEGVEASALFRELPEGKTKVSMRSKDFIDVAALARNFGGGGHARAAGFQMKASINDVKSKVLAYLSQQFKA